MCVRVLVCVCACVCVCIHVVCIEFWQYVFAENRRCKRLGPVRIRRSKYSLLLLYVIVNPRFARRWRTCGCCGHLEPQRGRLSSLTRVWSPLASSLWRSFAHVNLARRAGLDQPPRPPLSVLPPRLPAFLPPFPFSFLLLLFFFSLLPFRWWASPTLFLLPQHSFILLLLLLHPSFGFSDNTTVSLHGPPAQRRAPSHAAVEHENETTESLPRSCPAGTTRRAPGSRRAARWWAAGPRLKLLATEWEGGQACWKFCPVGAKLNLTDWLG